MSWLKACAAVDAVTGKRCTLPEHAGAHSASGHVFTEALRPGFQPRRPLDELAFSRPESSTPARPHWRNDAWKNREHQRRFRARRKAEAAAQR